jgi:hypothetical protein
LADGRQGGAFWHRPANFKSSLPSIEEIEMELKNKQ